MKWFLCYLCVTSVVVAAPIDEFVASAKSKHGEVGERAARFLVQHMPATDRETLSVEFLTDNLDLAFKARAEFPWAAHVPEEIFQNDVLPYAVFDETRDVWRPELYELARDLVKDAPNATAAAQTLNQQLFNLIKVHYNTGRKRPNQSLKESKDLGMATCTGLSVILVEACRAVGIPARAVGTPLWTNERGNHTWVEIWDGDWHFTGADEFDAAGLDRGWFVGDAAQAQADVPRHAIYATSWKRDGLTFPMVWARNSESVAAVNVTSRYAKPTSEKPELAQLGVRLWDKTGGKRLSAKVCVLDGVRRSCALADTRSGTADLNDMPRFNLEPGTGGWLRFTIGDEIREIPFGPLTKGISTVDAVWADLRPGSDALDAIRDWLALPSGKRPYDDPALRATLTRVESESAQLLLTADRFARLAAERKDEFDQQSITQGDRTLRWLERRFGDAPKEGHSLWISLHGGGNTAATVNDKQWQNQIRLYEPTEGIYVAPRAPTDTWNLWHEQHIDPMLQQLIDDYVVLRGVNPDRVYLMGYSAGGDGVWQLAPRMADRFAAAAMMAGHPNEASLLGLRNLPFAIFMGGQDAAYNRNQIAVKRSAQLDRLEQDDPGGYVHLSRIYQDSGHWMKKQDAEALPWLAGFERNPWPDRIVWQQDDVVHRRFYWLELPQDALIQDRQNIIATVQNRTIVLEGDVPENIILRLSDLLLDLDQPLTVVVNGSEVFAGTVTRNAAAMLNSLEQRADVSSTATATLMLTVKH